MEFFGVNLVVVSSETREHGFELGLTWVGRWRGFSFGSLGDLFPVSLEEGGIELFQLFSKEIRS